MTNNETTSLGHVGLLLGSCWIREMTTESLSALNHPSVQSALLATGWDAPAVSPETIETLAIDYCQLLIGPKDHLSPVESVWASQQFQSDSVSSMRKFFEILPGYQPPISFVDHIGVQLDFAGRLLLAESTDTEPVRLFAQKHFTWVKSLLNGVQHKAETDFYRGLARATEDWIACVAKTR